nr:hypothetical protein [Tanacetum cinerariifolium]
MTSNGNALWVKVKALHGQDGSFGLNYNGLNGIWSKIVGSSNYLHSNNILPSDSIRFWVGSVVESSNHIFFDGSIAKDIWNLIRNWCDILFPNITSFEHWKDWFGSCQASKEKTRRLSVIFASSLWWL